MAVLPEESLGTCLEHHQYLCNDWRMHNDDTMGLLDHLPHEEGIICLLQVSSPRASTTLKKGGLFYTKGKKGLADDLELGAPL